MTVDPELLAKLGRYLQIRDEQRADQVAATLAAMTGREARLFREAAVMGYVLGALGGRADRPPPDSRIVSQVISACRANRDLYPVVNALTEPDGTR